MATREAQVGLQTHAVDKEEEEEWTTCELYRRVWISCRRDYYQRGMLIL